MAALPSTGGLPGAQLQALRGEAARDPQAAVQAAARQFESLFMQELMKSMRAATPASGLMDNGGTQLGTEMLDQQFAQQLSGLPGGLADQIARQLARQQAAVRPADAPGGAPGAGAGAQGLQGIAPARALPHRPGSLSREALSPAALRAGSAPQQFVAQHRAAAQAAAQATGIPADFILAQAAHESGWGRREIRMPDGSSSHNVFGIKAGPGWTGKTTTVTTTEVVDGVPHKVRQTFRAYDSYAEAYTDHARLLSESPRYARVVTEGGSAQGFARSLQRAGYATDPDYASKLGRVIDTTVRVARSLQG